MLGATGIVDGDSVQGGWEEPSGSSPEEDIHTRPAVTGGNEHGWLHMRWCCRRQQQRRAGRGPPSPPPPRPISRLQRSKRKLHNNNSVCACACSPVCGGGRHRTPSPAHQPAAGIRGPHQAGRPAAACPAGGEGGQGVGKTQESAMCKSGDQQPHPLPAAGPARAIGLGNVLLEVVARPWLLYGVVG